MLAQGKDLIAPVTRLAKPGEAAGECRVIPAPRQPGAVVQLAQGAQGLDQWQLARVEVVELVVAVDQLCQLAEAFFTAAGEHHPQVLDRRAHPAVVEVDHVIHLVAMHQVARVQVAVQAHHLMWRACVDVLDPFQ